MALLLFSRMLAAKVARAFRESAPEVPRRELRWQVFNERDVSGAGSRY